MVLYVRRYVNRFVFILGLIATGWFIWANSIAPRMWRLPMDLLVGRALLQVLLACACGAAIAICVYLTVSWTARGSVQHPLRSVIVAAWYGPAMILMFALSPLPIATGGVLVFATTRAIVARWDRNRPLLSGFAGALFLKRLAAALACSVAIHMGVLALARGSTLLATALFAGTFATLTSLAIVVGAYAPAKPARLSHSVLGLLLIVLLTVGVRISKRGGSGVQGEKTPEAAVRSLTRVFLE